MFGGSLVIVEAFAHMTQNDTDAMTAVGRFRPFKVPGIVGSCITALRQRPEFVFDESLINPFDPLQNLE